ncbi:HD domain-containing phosphohydrolase [Undibacterium baiyunense]|uniref:Response regulator n=1 Tax=Undibacterium baiyunense TaxID=2828731 RepID=A0A941DFG0_9BURK|nr:HD domain-containing phosphohydrolase [Undibacterium baiyunense]MBR7746658.1 response regulator [Undibacterium baiyunense]
MISNNQAARILCVDDEPNILSSLKRLLRPLGYELIMATSGKEGLEVLNKTEIDLVISDMRMPEMNGAEFLQHVRELWPDTTRLLLTGYSDINSIIDAINQGQIYRYITKPWDENEILLIVSQAIERQQLKRDKIRLEALTQKQNEELRQLNSNLEIKVQERTTDLQRTHEQLLNANEQLKNNFLTSIKVFASVVELRGGQLAGRSRRVADLSRRIARQLKLDGRLIQEIFIAALLADIGKLSLSDDLLRIPRQLMNAQQLGEFARHIAKAEQILMPLVDLQDAVKMIRSQHERYDGRGFPHKLIAQEIPIGARIISLAGDFDGLQHGAIQQKNLATEEAIFRIKQSAGGAYDPEVVAAFEIVISGKAEEFITQEIDFRSLQAGMVLAQDLVTRDGLLILPADFVIEEKIVERLRVFGLSQKSPLIAKIRRKS